MKSDKDRDAQARELARDLYVHGGDDMTTYAAIASAYAFLNAWDDFLAGKEPVVKSPLDMDTVPAFQRARRARNRTP